MVADKPTRRSMNWVFIFRSPGMAYLSSYPLVLFKLQGLVLDCENSITCLPPCRGLLHWFATLGYRRRVQPMVEGCWHRHVSRPSKSTVDISAFVEAALQSVGSEGQNISSHHSHPMGTHALSYSLLLTLFSSLCPSSDTFQTITRWTASPDDLGGIFALPDLGLGCW